VKYKRKLLIEAVVLLLIFMFLMGCRSSDQDVGGETAVSASISIDEHEPEADAQMLVLPELTAVNLPGELLNVVATTSVIGDVVAQVGGGAIQLTTLMGPGQDPHSYEPAAQDLTAVSTAHVIFINGWNLEESLVSLLETVAETSAIVPASANIEPLPAGSDEHENEHEHGGADPHAWLNPVLVKQWVENIEQTLAALDPAQAETYRANALAYQAELDDLIAFMDAQLGTIPAENRVFVTNHDALGYLADQFGFEILGTVIPAASTLAEPSASSMVELVAAMEAKGVCAIFAETTASEALAQAVAAELSHCEQVQIIQIYTGAIGAAGSAAGSYIGMMKTNTELIVAGLR